MMEIHDYTWIFVLGIIAACADAFGIGANDVANSFASSVSSGSLTLAQACIIAVFTEFLGAFLLGSNTAETIKSGIMDVKLFVPQPELMMLGMLCAVAGSAVWVLTACRFGMPVSTTHSIVGAIIGVGIAAFGGDTIKWDYSGVAKIVTSWFVSPVAAGIVTAIIYMPTKIFVLKSVNSLERGIKAIPIYFFITSLIGAFYLIYKGAPGTKAAKMSIGTIVGISFGVAAGVTILAWVLFVPWLRRRVINKENVRWFHIPVIHFVKPRPSAPAPEEIPGGLENGDGTEIQEKITASGKTIESESNNEAEFQEQEKSRVKSLFTMAKDLFLRGVRKDVRNLDNQKLASVHEAAQKFDGDTEYLFSFLQVITACLASFSHGSNDVANAAGPIAAIYDIWRTAKVDPSGKAQVPSWILAMAGAAIDLGLLTYGYHVMRKLGNGVTYLSPSRGFSAELGTSLTVLTASKIGLPVSTTHCITGAITSIGLCNGSWRALNWKMLSWCFLSWIITLPAAGLLAGLLFAYGKNAPTQMI
ncbi:phosphate transporter [Linderina pennispora]|uniref:Phosphate transporter n=1 Tax=Linderina pennispora TaxID=61395 RepID=A0A1Y1WIG2_9FUNG|nr:phosphate transporter [Linderina pennispora]ORX73155.1 phosphate transporter [Linderina pennispora]